MSGDTTFSRPLQSDPRQLKVREQPSGTKTPLNITRKPIQEPPMVNVKGDREEPSED